MPAAPAPCPCPFTAAHARLTEALPALTVLCGPPRTGPGWVTSAALAAGGTALDTFLARDAAQAERDYGLRPRPDVVASLGLHRYAWHVCLLLTVPWFLHRRVPYLPVDAVSLHRASGRFTARAAGFACLPGDDAAGLPGARPVPDEEALRREVRAAVAAHLGPVLEAFRPRTRRGPRALWGMATDEVTEGLWRVGRLLGEEERARRELELLLPGGTPPYVGGAAFRELRGPGGVPLATRDRAGCCFFYTVRPRETCLTCPRTGDGERVRRLSAVAVD
ncbi:hypothetical protein GCM10010218_02880 [Streptomyces mashuensis]|uniref:Ferric siderophore reductase C-terminal domain-containing protein n=1 Tax=Streptomyces mashuensis TaxID=33904 RepID=A0A919AVE7_9ACTN|nr:(2Fe-2S)-binding protein [Streptomyces mashuensis]GHF25609.1 hypothetical protein GCM10010218_02880 [Streptomyces mashuensis]